MYRYIFKIIQHFLGILFEALKVYSNEKKIEALKLLQQASIKVLLN